MACDIRYMTCDILHMIYDILYAILHDMALHDMAWHGMTWHGIRWYGVIWFCMTWYGPHHTRHSFQARRTRHPAEAAVQHVAHSAGRRGGARVGTRGRSSGAERWRDLKSLYKGLPFTIDFPLQWISPYKEFPLVREQRLGAPLQLRSVLRVPRTLDPKPQAPEHQERV